MANSVVYGAVNVYGGVAYQRENDDIKRRKQHQNISRGEI